MSMVLEAIIKQAIQSSDCKVCDICALSMADKIVKMIIKEGYHKTVSYEEIICYEKGRNNTS